jgi:hypothetical protein
MRNSLIPIATLLGLSLPAIISGALITESVFNYPGGDPGADLRFCYLGPLFTTPTKCT